MSPRVMKDQNMSGTIVVLPTPILVSVSLPIPCIPRPHPSKDHPPICSLTLCLFPPPLPSQIQLQCSRHALPLLRAHLGIYFGVYACLELEDNILCDFESHIHHNFTGSGPYPTVVLPQTTPPTYSLSPLMFPFSCHSQPFDCIPLLAPLIPSDSACATIWLLEAT